MAQKESEDTSKLHFVGQPLEGVGIHSGKRFRVRLFKSSSLVFRISRGDKVYESPALWTRLSGTTRATALVLRAVESQNSKARRSSLRFEIKTIEHFLAAFMMSALSGYALWIEALDPMSDTDAYELPILEGASAQWLKWIQEQVSGDDSNVVLPERRKVWKILRSFEIKHEDKFVQLLPSENESDTRSVFSCFVSFPDIWQQRLEFSYDWCQPVQGLKDFSRNIAPARTFGFEHELKELEKRGLAKGGSMDNALLLTRTEIKNEGGFCVPQELAAHKILDAIGDFALLGAPIIGRIELSCAGHFLHLRTVAEAMRKGVLVSGFLDRQGRFHRQDS